jgi:hypothetical protein
VRVTHVLLPVVALTRRRDLAELIGLALVAKAAGRGQRPGVGVAADHGAGLAAPVRRLGGVRWPVRMART